MYEKNTNKSKNVLHVKTMQVGLMKKLLKQDY